MRQRYAGRIRDWCSDESRVGLLTVQLVFQPPYCPEVNLIERVWRELKRELAWVHFDDVGQLQPAISQWVCRLSAESLRSLTQGDWIVDALCVAGI
ncbi:transposase [Leptolyngbya sp. O-77]|uniref:transposase n=1 Tax=Leptolyngbya sp. O-77 TaxID=1080068 RepID=UPI000839A1D9|nr:transposase [Leptolyngbya sp. O-77]